MTRRNYYLFVTLSLFALVPPLGAKGMFDDAKTCGLPGLRFSDDVLYQGILENNNELIKCAVKQEKANLAGPRICYKLPTCETIQHIFDKTDNPKQLQLIIENASAEQLNRKTARGANSMEVLLRKFGSKTDDALLAALRKKGFAPEESMKQFAAAPTAKPQPAPPKAVQTEAKTSDFVPHASRICLSYKSDGSLVCTAANAKTVSCPGDKEWRGPGPCSKYARKKVSDLAKKEWADLIWVYNYEIEKRNAPESKPGLTKTEKCNNACLEKKCRRYNQPGVYQESASASMRCVGFCKQECSYNPDAYR